VLGTPVNELVRAEDPRVVDERKKVRVEKDLLYDLSSVKGNKVFKEKDGMFEYRIGPLDEIRINSHIGEKVTETTITVTSRGKITYSFVDDLDVVGLTPSELDEILTSRLSRYIKMPRIEVWMKSFKSKCVTVLGEFASLRSIMGVAESGRIFLEGKTTIMDLIAMAGGYTEDADIKNVKLVRNGKPYIINLYDIIEKGDESRNIIIDAGDMLDIPSLPEFGESVYVMGEVNSQGIYPLKGARDILAAITLAGDVTSLAKEENTLVVRGYPYTEKPLVMMTDLKALFRKADLEQNIRLKEGDLVYVPRMLIGDINEWITNTLPLLDFIFYPKRFQYLYFRSDYLHFNPK